MKNLKALAMMITLVMSSITFAQLPGGGQGPPPMPNSKQIKEMVAKMSEEISFTEEQETLIQGIYTSHYEIVSKKVSGGSRPKREDMEALDKKLKEDVAEVLDDEQMKKYEAHLKKHKKDRPSR